MKVIAEIDGWRKLIDIAPEIIERGFFYIPIRRPINILTDRNHIVKNDSGETKVKLTKTEGNIFKYIP